MKIEKAIQNNEEMLSRGSMIDDPDDNASIRLGIEALKRVLDARNSDDWLHPTELPGETEGD